MCRKAFHWDNCDLEKMLVVRPLGEAACGGTCEWQWSGGFHVATRYSHSLFPVPTVCLLGLMAESLSVIFGS